MGKQWYALNTKPHKELIVYNWLKAQDVDAYLPLLQVTPKNPRARKQRPWFPGYLFVHVDLVEIGTDFLSHVPGAKRLVGAGNEPVEIQESIIHRIADELDRINFAPKPTYQFEHGEAVKIVSGPFEGYSGIFDRHLQAVDRVQILLQLIHNQPKVLKIDPDQIDRVR